jgi:signal transduction histidine kinase
MLRRVPSLRSLLTAVTVAGVLLSLVVATALLVLTTRLHDTSVDLAASIESVRLAEEAEVSLLLYGRTTDPMVRQNIATDLRHNLSEARRYVTSVHEAQALEHATAQVELLLGSTTGLAARETTAYDALETLIDVNVEESRRLQDRAAGSNRLAYLIAITVTMLVLVVAAVFLWWLRRRAFAPILDLASAMEQFGRGNRAARAAEVGPPELRDMVTRFNQMADALDAQHGAQTAFIGGVAHDLRNPLGVLMLQLELARPDRPLPPEPVLRNMLDVIAGQLSRLERMLGDLVDMSRIEAGSLELQVVEQDARDIVRQVVKLFQNTSPGHQIRCQLPAERLPIRCDPLRIEQVITNLVSNAIKYSPAGGRVDVQLSREDNGVLIAVSDQGLGISEEDQQRLFEPFRRVGLSMETIPGVGLGLFVVRRIVEAHHGRINVESSPGKGSCFRIWLPSSPILDEKDEKSARKEISPAATKSLE